MTWNENYMIRYFLRYYETVADRIFVIDDNSDDGTRELILKSPKCEIIDYPYSSGLHDEEKRTLFSNIYVPNRDAEWVIIVDCDEFVYHPNLRDFLDEKRKEGRRAIKTTGYICASKEIPDTDGQLFDATPYKQFSRQYCKQVVFDPKLDVSFRIGQHPPTQFSDGVLAGQCGLNLYHCCYLSRDWIIDHLKRRFSRYKHHAFDLDYATDRGLRLYNRMVNA
jgi:glycosyltransferase involved in cell wall biosynthesis